MELVSKHIIHGIYDDDAPLMDGVVKLREAGVKITECYTPFPIHGLDSAMGLKRTRLAICAFIYGLTGASLATLMMWYMMVSDWPTDIGGKPSFAYFMNVPAFIPITFESTVLCAGHGMALTYLLRCFLLPGVRPKNPDPRTTDDKFMIYLELPEAQVSQAESILKSTGASEVNHKGTKTVEAH